MPTARAYGSFFVSTTEVTYSATIGVADEPSAETWAQEVRTWLSANTGRFSVTFSYIPDAVSLP